MSLRAALFVVVMTAGCSGVLVTDEQGGETLETYALPGGSIQIRVLLWNILYAGWENTNLGIAHWNNGRREKVIALARAADADVMLFQEVSPAMFQDLKAAFSGGYHSHLRQKLVGSNTGNAIFSRFPMSQLGGFQVDDRDRGCASAVIQGSHFYSCHLPPPGHYTNAYRIAAARVVPTKVKEPLVLGGDFNTQGDIGIYEIVKGPYQGCGKGVDHLFTGQSCSVLDIIEREDNGWPSDHDGILIQVQLPPPPSYHTRAHMLLSKGTRFAYQTNQGWWAASKYNAAKIAGRVVAGDFDGDHREDVAMIYDYGSNEMRVHVLLSKGTRFAYQTNQGWWAATKYNPAKITDRVVAGDFDGDGRDDLAMLYDYGSGRTRAHVLLSKGDRFAYQTNQGWWATPSGYNAERITGRVVAGDFNGDGRDDLAMIYDYGSGRTRAHVLLSTGTRFAYQTNQGWWATPSGYNAERITGRVVAGDFNGDRRDDIAMLYDYGANQMRVHVLLSKGNRFAYQGNQGWWSATKYNPARITGRVVAGDFDGNGRDDISMLYDYSSGRTRAHVLLSQGDRFAYQTNQGWWATPSGYNANRTTGRVVAGDFDGNGRCDISLLYDYGRY